MVQCNTKQAAGANHARSLMTCQPPRAQPFMPCSGIAHAQIHARLCFTDVQVIEDLSAAKHNAKITRWIAIAMAVLVSADLYGCVDAH